MVSAPDSSAQRRLSRNRSFFVLTSPSALKCIGFGVMMWMWGALFQDAQQEPAVLNPRVKKPRAGSKQLQDEERKRTLKKS